MKQIIIFSLIIAGSGMVACSGPDLKNKGITGKYVRREQFDSGTLFDTITVQSINGSTEQYEVSRNTVDSPQDKHTNKTYLGTYDSRANVLKLNDPSKVFYFNEDQKGLKSGKNQYTKLP